MATAQDYVICVPEHGVAVCRKCCNAVWPHQARTHLQQSHAELRLRERTAIANDLNTWSVLYRSTDPSFALPVVVEGPIPGLQLMGSSANVSQGGVLSLPGPKKLWTNIGVQCTATG